MAYDTTSPLFRTDPERLARVFAMVDDDRPYYRPEELGDILRHQLAARVEFDLHALDPGIRRLLRAAGEGGDGACGIRTFRDLFLHPEPPIQLLHLTKQFAKRHLSHEASLLPPEIATVLYYASLAASYVRAHRHITWLTHAEFCQGLDQVLSQPWLDEELRALFQLARARLDQSPSAANDRPQP